MTKWKMMPLNGEMMTIHRASTLYGVPENTLRDRVAGGMTLQEAVDTPYVPKGSPLYSYNGERMTKKEIAAKTGTSLTMLSSVMYRYGFNPGEAADYLIACNKPIEYKGKTMTLHDFARSTKRKCHSMYIMICKNGMTPEEAIATTEVKHGGMTRTRAARLMCGEIFSAIAPEEVDFRQQNEQLYTFESGLYRYEIRFASDRRATLTAIFKDPEHGDIISAVWLYSINEHGIVRTGRGNT